MTTALEATANILMRAVVRSSAIRNKRDDDVTLAVKVLREEMKAFIDLENPKYNDERALTLGAGSGLAMASLTTECIRRIIAERAN